jgi:hypothetical protein
MSKPVSLANFSELEHYQTMVDTIIALEPRANQRRVELSRKDKSDEFELVLRLDPSLLRCFAGKERLQLSFEVSKDSEGLYRPVVGTHVFARTPGGVRPLVHHCRIGWFERLVSEHLADANFKIQNDRDQEHFDHASRILGQVLSGPRL